MKSENGNNTRVEAFAQWVIRWRWVILLATLVGVAGIGSGARHIEFKNNYRVFFSEENPQLRSFDALQIAPQASRHTRLHRSGSL